MSSCIFEQLLSEVICVYASCAETSPYPDWPAFCHLQFGVQQIPNVPLPFGFHHQVEDASPSKKQELFQTQNFLQNGHSV